jgi:2-succinyl-5-enolpyruvyl-6-hydroxy-3-cyclohexene-1-carboxylate synthase
MSPPNLQTEWARLLLASLRQAGVREVVVSPGGRSTPFTWAALSDPGLRCRAIIDERAAAFFAVGHARITGDPVLLICTSGSAAANYYPALVEASEAGVPVVVLTADRGLELQQAAGPQTIDQPGLFGRYARAAFDLGAPDGHPRMLRAVQRLAAQAVLTTRSPLPGPVQLNARARKPLGPEQAADAGGERLREEVDTLIARGVTAGHAPDSGPGPAGLALLADACRAARRGLIVCGPQAPTEAADAADIAALARATGFAVVAEPASQQRFAKGVDPDRWIDGFALLLTGPAFRDAHEPDLVVQVGRPPTATEWGAYLGRWPDTPRHVLAARGWPDPWSTATAVVSGPIGLAVRALTAAVGSQGASAGQQAPSQQAAWAERDAWLDRLRHANRAAWAAVDHALAGGFSEGSAVRAVVEAVPDGGVLALGNSLPIREAEMFVPADRRDLIVWAQRGANGIDGLVSGAAGAAAAAGRPTTLLLGDVSLAHDIGGLAAARDAGALTIVVLNNGGGRIFERLPMAERLEGHAEFDAWLTPPALDLAAAAAAFGIQYTRAAHREELDAALRHPARSAAARLIEVVIPDGGTTLHQRELVRRLEAELAR